MIRVSRRYRFSASHRLHIPGFSEDRNQDLFGKCNNPFGHGHNYEIEVVAEGPLDQETGRAVDLNILDDLVRREILSRYDHRYLNEELPDFVNVVPTTENLAVAIETHLARAWPAVFPQGWPRLVKIRIFETPRNIFEIQPGVASADERRTGI